MEYHFYEKGIWCTLGELMQLFEMEKIQYAQSDKEGLTEAQQVTIGQEFAAWESRIELMEKVEASLIPSIAPVNSIANKELAIRFNLMEVATTHTYHPGM